MAISKQVFKNMFPQENVKFAMFGDYVNRYERQVGKLKQPKLDLIIAVDDLKAFHTKNIQKDINGKDYTYLARMTKGKIVTYF